MSTPTWLPPLNSHESYIMATSIEEADDIPDFPLVTEDVFFIDVIVAVKFFKQNTNVWFPGLFLKHRFAVPCRAVGNSPYHWKLLGEITNTMLTYMGVPFQLDPIYFRETNNDFSLHDGNGLVHKILGALYDIRSRSHTNVIPLRWKILKHVEISNDEFDAWVSWLAEKVRVDPNFEHEYVAAITRPRTTEELLYEQLVKFRAATASSIEALEVVKVENLDSTSNCLVCLEDFSPGTEAFLMPCDHVFHRDCIVRWLQQSHMCPLCRHTLPTCVKN